MNQSITTAVIAVAGWGTRWLPLTKAVEKCMVPVGDRPAIDWVVADCVAAGVTRIIFVIGEAHTQIRQYFSHNAELNAYLTEKSKTSELQVVNQPQYQHVSFEFIIQPNDGRYGTVYPVALAASYLEDNESVLFLNGDDFIYRTDGGSETLDFIQSWQASGAAHGLMVREVPKAQASAYGVIQTTANGHYSGILEKPSPAALENFDRTVINLGKYIFAPSMFARATQYMDRPVHEAEFFLTTPITEAAVEGEEFFLHEISGQHLDAGNPASWLVANQVIVGVEQTDRPQQ